MKIEIWPIDRVIPYARNARTITPAAVDKVAASIQEFGWQQPVVVDAQQVIVAGHTRLLAARKLDLKEIPVHVASDLTPAQIKAYRLMDNRSHQENTWDVELVGLELEDLQLFDINLSLTGFDDQELVRILSGESLTDSIEDVDAPDKPNQNQSLSDRFVVPPFSVLDARQGYWQKRKRAWLAIGIKSELGRGDNGLPGGSARPAADYSNKRRGDGVGRAV